MGVAWGFHGSMVPFGARLAQSCFLAPVVVLEVLEIARRAAAMRWSLRACGRGAVPLKAVSKSAVGPPCVSGKSGVGSLWWC